MLEDQLLTVSQLEEIKKEYYRRLNVVYDNITMKIGLISNGFQQVMVVLEPYLREMARKKAAPPPEPRHE